MLSFYPGVNNALRQRGFRPAFSVRKRLPPRVPLVAAGQSVATARFRSTSPEQLKRGAANRDRTVSRSCPAQKSKKFVSRAWSRSAALRGSFRLGPERLLCRSPLRRCQRRHPVRQHTETEAGKAASSRQQRQLVSNALLSAAVRPCAVPADRVPPLHCPPTCYDQPVDNRTEPRTARQWIRYLVVAVIALFLVWWMLRVYVL